MMSIFRNRSKRAAGEWGESVRLQLEELEGRCLLSTSIIPIGAVIWGPDGNIWFPEVTKIGQLNPSTGVLRQFDLPAGMLTQRELIAGPDGNLWFTTEGRSNEIAKLDPNTGAIQDFPFPTGTGPNQQMTFGPDGNIWFADWHTGAGYFMGRMNPTTGAIQDFPLNLDVLSGMNGGIIAGPDGNLWFADANGIGKFNLTTNTLQMYAVGFSKGLTVGPDGNIWFNHGSFAPFFGIGRINPSDGSVQEFPLPNGHGFDEGMTTGPDGNIWFTGWTAGNINTTTDAIQLVNLPAGANLLWGITKGNDGNIWFSYEVSDSVTGLATGYIGQLNPATGTIRSFALIPAAPTPTPAPTPAPTPTPTPAPTPTPSASQTTSTDNSLSASGTTISGLSTIAFNQVVAFFTPQTPVAAPGSAYQASIDWGDGNTSLEILTVAQNNTYAVSGGHAYQASGTYWIKVTIAPNNATGLDSTVTVFTTAQIAALIPINM